MALISMRTALGIWIESLDQSHPFGPKTSLTLRHSSSSKRGPWMRSLNGSFAAQLSCYQN